MRLGANRARAVSAIHLRQVEARFPTPQTVMARVGHAEGMKCLAQAAPGCQNPRQRVTRILADTRRRSCARPETGAAVSHAPWSPPLAPAHTAYSRRFGAGRGSLPRRDLASGVPQQRPIRRPLPICGIARTGPFLIPFFFIRADQCLTANAPLRPTFAYDVPTRTGEGLPPSA